MKKTKNLDAKVDSEQKSVSSEDISYKLSKDPSLTQGSMRVTINAGEEKVESIILFQIPPIFAYFNKKKQKSQDMLHQSVCGAAAP